MSCQLHPDRPGTKKQHNEINTRKERKDGGDLGNSCRVKCQRRAGRGAFSSTTEVWDGRLESGHGRWVSAEVFVKAHSLRDRGGKRRESEAGRGDGEEINGAAGDHPLARHGAHTHAALMAFSRSLYLSLTPTFPFIPPLHPTVGLSIRRPASVSVCFLHSPPSQTSLNTFWATHSVLKRAAGEDAGRVTAEHLGVMQRTPARTYLHRMQAAAAHGYHPLFQTFNWKHKSSPRAG